MRHSFINLKSPYLKSAHDEGNDDVPLLLRHLGGDCQQHEHVVALGHAHRVQVGQHVGTRNLALYINFLAAFD